MDYDCTLFENYNDTNKHNIPTVVDDFEREIDNALKISDDRIKTVITQFSNCTNIKDTIACELYTDKNGKRICNITTAYPGLWIGRHGDNLKLLQALLKNEYDTDITVHFDTLHGKIYTL